MEGIHLTADCFDCQVPIDQLIDANSIQMLMTQSALAAGLTIVGEKFHPFIDEHGNPAGVTGVLLLAESHVAIHTWPERNAVTLDVYVCNFNSDNSEKAHFIIDSLLARFGSTRVLRQALRRGTNSSFMADELLTAHSIFSTRIHTKLAESRSAFQHIEISESAEFGKIMRIDGAMMTSERDEFIYHESLIHPAAITHPRPKRALIIGGGDGGSTEELLKHPSIEEIVLCEIDPTVIALAREHLKSIHKNSLDAHKVIHVAQDGFKYIEANESYSKEDQFDLIYLDLTDPVTPQGSGIASSCMTPAFFSHCYHRLADGGRLVLHLGSPFFHAERFTATLEALKQAFKQVHPYTVYIPLYGALWGMAIAVKGDSSVVFPPQEINAKILERGLTNLQYYNGDVHPAMFALPNYVRQLC